MRTDVFLRGLGQSTVAMHAPGTFPSSSGLVSVSSGGAYDPNAYYNPSEFPSMSLTVPTYGGAGSGTSTYAQQPTAAPAAPALQVSRGTFEDAPADAYGATFRSIAPGEPSPAGAAPAAAPWGLILALGALLLGG
jgi:hypothetical protein